MVSVVVQHTQSQSNLKAKKTNDKVWGGQNMKKKGIKKTNKGTLNADPYDT